jgi:hypothetical protein
MRRTIALALTSALLAGGIAGAVPAGAVSDCYIEPDGSGPLPELDYPCPSADDQPVPQPVAVVTFYGPGYNSPESDDWTRLTHGGRIWFVNTDTLPHEYRGNGFATGWVAPGATVEVHGVSTLPLGYYRVYDGSIWTGHLYIDPDPITVG